MSQIQNITIPITESALKLIDSAAKAVGKSREDFILEILLPAAENTLCDQTQFSMNSEDFDAFSTALDAPVRSNNPLIEELLNKKAPWE